jgi:hypothetical protein
MPEWQPMGDALDVAYLGEVELARYRALEAMAQGSEPGVTGSVTRATRSLCDWSVESVV